MNKKKDYLLNRAQVPEERTTYSGAGESARFSYMRRLLSQPPIVGNSLLLIAFSFLFFASPAEAKKLKVVTTLSDFSSLAATVGGERVEAESLARGYQDPHFVEPKPSFVLKLHGADMLIVAGLELEIGYLPPLLDQARNEKIRPTGAGYLDASAGCEILEQPTDDVVVLPGQEVGGREQRGLSPVERRRGQRPGCHRRLAGADVALDQPQHRHVAREVVANLVKGADLVRCQRDRVPHLARDGGFQ